MAGKVSKFASKLEALPPLKEAGPNSKPNVPTLQALRERIQSLLQPNPGLLDEDQPYAERTDTEEVLPFVSEALVEFAYETVGEEDERLFVRRRKAPLSHRVGHAPLWGALQADPTILALLALEPGLAETDFSRALYLDTETTGLMGGTGTVPFLLGLAYHEGEHFVVEQVLLRTFAEERAMLLHLERRLRAASCVITYNGKTFDLPLLRSRAVLNRVRPLSEPVHLDLLHVARRLHRHRLSSCSLKSIESQVLGRDRVGDVEGAEIAAIYWHYVRTGDGDVLAGVLEHNELDVLSMISLVGLYGEALEQGVHPEDLAMAARVANKIVGTRALREKFGEQRAEDAALPDEARSKVRAVERAASWSSVALEKSASGGALSVAAEVARTRGDKAAALHRYEQALAALLRDEDPLDQPLSLATRAVRKELVKLYEHHAKDFDRALLVLREGTGEAEALVSKRHDRLVKKREASRLKPPPAAGTARKSKRGGAVSR
jgi:uncharacterized protein YprB with RNaseH-like and TPR domain